MLASLAAVGGLGSAAPARAADADWPRHAVTLVVPFVPGGTTDIVSRIVGQKLSDALHQPVIVDNRGGAGGTLGAAYAARAPADGYTFFMATIAHTMAPGLYKSLPYDFMRDFDPVSLVALTPNVLIVNPALPVQTPRELIAYIQAHPGTVNYGSAGAGSTEHLSGALFGSMAGVNITHVPYKGGAPMMTDLMAGNIQMAIETSPSASQQVRAGKVRALAVTGAERSSAYPGVPTMKEAGVPGYEVVTWFAIMAPHGTPQPVMDRMRSELGRALHSADVEKKFADQGVTPGDMPAERLPAFIRSETTRWAQVVKSSGAKVD
jgi:tripartite-type tricarboxylate transporter receptor subunit TctC